ncbi:acyl-coenzyme A synthetase/AMP-(fatty) acid ligase [Candidatus Scalindua japonica]|uniref:Acyl-coenzyme A synthetase/AMP-(Fatty) acid ligase n=1 Tax=Candidatus Scalindua japonica TaxID=1284222 RepID=A0A286U3X9_9BACT|nr:acyl-coenzyme A synthetase/AMP-(fatty) acid ligase [Candidatus Scalindua japonica]
MIPISSGGSDSVYERIGVVFVFGKDTLTEKIINKSMRDQAVKVGADAIIYARYKDIETDRYFESFGSAFVDFDWAKKQGTGNWLMKGRPVGAGLVISYKASQKK